MKNQWHWGNTKWWPERAKLIAKQIEPEASVIEFGAGHGMLNTLLDGPYVPVDLYKFRPDTIVCDLDNTMPNINNRFDYAVVQGLVEYLFNRTQFFKGIAKFSSRLLLTYSSANEIELVVFETKLQEIGWRIVAKQPLDGHQYIYTCVWESPE